MGYHQAGFEVVGVDIKRQKRYPFEFIQADALEILADRNFLNQFDVIAASPPCQTHSATKHLRNAQGKTTDKIDLIPETRTALQEWGGIYVIENVPGAPLINPTILCGSSFELKVRRHRHFESNVELTGLPCDHKAQGRPVGVYGSMRDEIPGGGTHRQIFRASKRSDGYRLDALGRSGRGYSTCLYLTSRKAVV